MKLCICTKFHEYILNCFRDVQIYIFDGFKKWYSGHYFWTKNFKRHNSIKIQM